MYEITKEENQHKLSKILEWIFISLKRKIQVLKRLKSPHGPTWDIQFSVIYQYSHYALAVIVPPSMLFEDLIPLA